MKLKSVVLGVKAHIGWATGIAIHLTDGGPQVLLNTRLELSDPSVPETREPYHQAAEVSLKEATRIIDVARKAMALRAYEQLLACNDLLREQDAQIGVVAVLQGSGRLPVDLADSIKSHTQVHIAEGEETRNVIIKSGERLGIVSTRLVEKTLMKQAADCLALDATSIESILAGLKETAGRPWRQEHKLAALAAWLTSFKGL